MRVIVKHTAPSIIVLTIERGIMWFPFPLFQHRTMWLPFPIFQDIMIYIFINGSYIWLLLPLFIWGVREGGNQ